MCEFFNFFNIKIYLSVVNFFFVKNNLNNLKINPTSLDYFDEFKNNLEDK
jgi:hypothetical protein